jgi:hypothetical protein
MEATELAAAFRRALEVHSELIGMALPSDAIENAYPTFCGALGLAWAPPFKREMPRKRHFHERDEHGKRKTARRYTLLDPKIGRRTARKRSAVECGIDAGESAIGIAAAPALDET